MFVVSSMMLTTALASTTSLGGLEASLTSSKAEYNVDEDINHQLTVKNNNSYDVNNIQTTINLPEGITLKKGSITNDAFSL